jgi:protein-S-isoprenylcysteine O-methyltransferase Ste14
MALLQTVGWIAGIVYATIPTFWLVVHLRVDYWRARRRSPYLVLLPLWVAMWMVLGLGTAHWRQITLYSTPWSWLPAAVLFMTGLGIYKYSGQHFSSAQLGGLPEILTGRREQRLVTSGIRQWIRHPVYLAHLCEMLAWSIGTGLLVLYALTAFGVITGGLMIQLEDNELEQRFGEEYSFYRQRVPALWPRLRA